MNTTAASRLTDSPGRKVPLSYPRTMFCAAAQAISAQNDAEAGTSVNGAVVHGAGVVPGFFNR